MEQRFEWDEGKRLSNIDKHGIDFEDAIDVFDGRPATTRQSDCANERRYVTTAIVRDKYITVVWTPRGDRIRLISARRSREAERRDYGGNDRE